MHMLSRKDLNSAELETIRVFRNPTKVFTANGEVQTTHEETTVYVPDFELFVKQALRRTRILICVASDQKPQLDKHGKIILCNTQNFVPIVVPRLSTSFPS